MFSDWRIRCSVIPSHVQWLTVYCYKMFDMSKHLYFAHPANRCGYLKAIASRKRLAVNA